MVPRIKTAFELSVIIPMEFHRGQAIHCIAGWVHQKDCDADKYQLVISAPDNLDADTEAQVLALLRPWDIFEKYPFCHDMGLIAEAAELAEGELLFFTESHCLPESNAISTILSVVGEHPEWSGFSCRTQPITHNMLSEIEAELYDDHIRNLLESTGWLKVLDQSFLIRRVDYFAVGGFRHEFGHFAEWLLAAELHRHGKVIGYYSNSLLKHYYVGEINDLEEFTLDFSVGHIKYLAECGNETTSAYFPKIPELQVYCQRLQSDYVSVLYLKTKVLPKVLPKVILNCLKKIRAGEPYVSIVAVINDWLKALFKCAGISTYRKVAGISAWLAKKRLQKALRFEDRRLARVGLIDWFSKLVSLGRLQYLADNPGLQNSWRRNTNFPISDILDFNSLAHDYTSIECLGFFDEEETVDHNRFRWSETTAVLWLPLYQGSYRIIIEWLPVRPLSPFDLIHLQYDGCTIDSKSIKINTYSLTIDVVSDTKSLHKLCWTVTPFAANGDKRILGLPVSKIHWFVNNELSESNDHARSLNPALQPVYFLHVRKCAGTSIRLLMDNMYDASEIMSPYAGKYYPKDLTGEESNYPHAFCRGHFRWMIPSLFPEVNWNIVTVLRDPVDRMLSLFFYNKQIKKIHENLTFEEWFENHLTLEDTIVGNFLTSVNDTTDVGAKSVNKQTLALLSQAQNNLKKCLAVGLLENIEESLNILAWRMNILVPKFIPRNNPTLQRSAAHEISDQLRTDIESVLAADMILYKEASERFARDVLIMHAEFNAYDSKDIRHNLRLRYIEQMALAGKALSNHLIINWKPDNIFYGDNLHPRELYQDGCLRWTGPNRTTNFYFYLGEPRDMRIAIRLYAVTPYDNVLSPILKLNNLDVPVTVLKNAEGDYEILANLSKETLSASKNGVAEFMLTTEIVRGEGEFRQLGVALKNILIQEI